MELRRKPGVLCAIDRKLLRSYTHRKSHFYHTTAKAVTCGNALLLSKS